MADPSLAQAALSVLSGSVVGLVLGLVGGGGSILAVPLLVHVVGVPSPHAAIGTGAVAVALNAVAGLAAHAFAATVRWRCAAVFAAAGVAGAFAGATLGKAVDGQKLLALFGPLMVLVGLLALRPRRGEEDAGVRLTRASAPRLLPLLLPVGAGVGLLSGFFGVGGGFLIVPGLVLATGMPPRDAVGTSLVAVAAFGLATAGSYAVSGHVDWGLAALFVAGGAAGSVAGAKAGAILGARKRALAYVFSAVVIAAGLYVTARGIGSLTGTA